MKPCPKTKVEIEIRRRVHPDQVEQALSKLDALWQTSAALCRMEPPTRLAQTIVMKLQEAPMLPNTIVGPNAQGLGLKIIAKDGPSRLICDGERAEARLLFARSLLGTKYDALARENLYVVDEAILRPWPAAKNELLRVIKLAGLTPSYDQASAKTLQDKQDRILARYSRYWPQEDGGWHFDPGTIKPEHKAEVAEGLRYLGWGHREYLHSFTFDDVSEMCTKQDALLGPTMGYGKCRAFLAMSEYWKYKEGASTTLIVALNRHLPPWEEELGGIAGVKPCELLVSMYGPACYEKWVTKEVPRFDQPFLLISLERLKKLSEDELALLNAKVGSIGVDEGYVISNMDAQHTRAVFKLKAPHHVLITGTAIKNHIGQLLPLLQWTFRGGSLALPDYPTDRAGSQRRWNARFLTFATGEDGSRKRVPFVRNIEEVHELLAPLMKRRLRAEPDLVNVLGEATIEPERIAIDLDPLHMNNYRAVLQQFTDWYKRELAKRGKPIAIPPNDILIKLGYLVWNVGSPWRMEDHSEADFTWPAYPKQLTAIHHKAIEIALSELELGNRVIIAGAASSPLELLASTLNEMSVPSGIIHCKISDAQRAETMAQCRSGDLQVLVGSLGTISEALNLSFANRIIVTEYTWDPSKLNQLLGRITRGIQETLPKAYFLYGKGTIQEYVLATCDNKQDSISAVLDRTKQSTDTSSILDLRVYCNSLVGVADEEQLTQRSYELDFTGADIS